MPNTANCLMSELPGSLQNLREIEINGNLYLDSSELSPGGVQVGLGHRGNIICSQGWQWRVSSMDM